MALDQPTVVASDTSQGIILAWDSITDATGYKVRWALTSADCYSGTVVEVTDPTYTLETEYYGKPHFFSILATSSGDESDPSSAVSGIQYMLDWAIHINNVDLGQILCVAKIGDNLFGGTDAAKVITKTCCGTAEWTQLGNDCGIPKIYSITHDSSNDILIVGGDVDGSNRTVAYTTDSGDSWNYCPEIGNGPGGQNEIVKDGLIFKNGLLCVAGKQGYNNPSDKYGNIPGWGYRNVVWTTSDYTNFTKAFESEYYSTTGHRNLCENLTYNTSDRAIDEHKIYLYFSYYVPGYGYFGISSDSGRTWAQLTGPKLSPHCKDKNGRYFKHLPHNFYYFDCSSLGVYATSGDVLHDVVFSVNSTIYPMGGYKAQGADVGYNNNLFFWTTSNDVVNWWCDCDNAGYPMGTTDVFSASDPDTKLNALITTSDAVFLVGQDATGYTTDWYGLPYTAPPPGKLRMLYIGDSDYSDKVITWPKITRKANNFQSVNVSITLDNNSADLNLFYNNVYNIPQTILLKISDPSTDYDLQTIYTGYLKQVKYSDNKCILTLKDKLFDFYRESIGTNETPVEFSSVIPSDMLWTICTCYGGLSNTETTSNTDIDYQSFLDISHTFSYDNLTCSGRFAGVKISEALTDFVKMTNCLIYTERDGRLTFKNFLKEQSSATVHLDTTKYNKFDIDIDSKRLINRQYVYFNYNVSSNDWDDITYRENATSQESYGLHENILKSNKIWLENSADANILADQILLSYKAPPKELTVKSTLYAREYEIGNAMSLTNSFYSLDSNTDWRITEYIFDMSNGSIIFTLDGASLNPAFYLDVSCLDGSDLLL